MSKRGIKISLAIVVLASVLGLSACESVGFYSQVVKGHSQIMLNREPIDVVLNKPSTDEALRAKLEVIKQAREFAIETLKLPDNGSYTDYVDTGKRYIVWNVVATPPYSTRPIEHCFPVAGCVSYRGYYQKAAAEAYAEKLKADGLDVIVSGASAYSTLGWFSDPVVNTMLYRSDLALAGLMFHELSHQKVYTAGDTAFNESFASTVELAGVDAWVKAQQSADIDKEKLDRYKASKSISREVVQLVLKHRLALERAYRETDRNELAQLAEVKKQGFEQLREAYKKLRASGGGSRGYDQWFAGPLNNASLVLFGDYHGWVNAFDALLAEVGSDWARFYASVAALADLDKQARRQKLEALQK